MSIIAEWTHELHVLQRTFEAVPDLELSLEEIHPLEGEEEGTNAFYLWVRTSNFESFEAVIENDPHCETATHLSEVGDRRLYRLTASEAGMSAILYAAVAKHDIVVLDSTITRGGVESRARIPSRDALSAFKTVCEDRELWFSLTSLYREQAEKPSYDITTPQREALLEAFDAGYFDVPRSTTLGEVAQELGISDQALSARLRRGQAHLIDRTLATGTSST